MHIFMIILLSSMIDIGSCTFFLTRLIRTPQYQPVRPIAQWPDDLATSNQVVFRPLFLYKHKQEEKRINQEQKRKEQEENFEVEFLDNQRLQHDYYYDPYYYYYYQQYYNRPNLKNQTPLVHYNDNNEVRRQQIVYKTN